MKNSKITAVGFDLFGVLIIEPPKLNQSIIELSKELRSAGYMVGLLSNLDANYEFLHEYHEVFGYFDRVQLSSEVGVAKPNPQAYERFVMQLGAKPEETLFVDDSPENVRGAKAAGLHAIEFTDTEELREQLPQYGIKV